MVRGVLDGRTLLATRSSGGRTRVELVHADGPPTVVDHVDGTAQLRFGRLLGDPVVRRDGDAVLVDPVTGEDRVVVRGAAGLARVGPDRLVALGRLDWWVADGSTGRRIGDRRELALGQPVVGDGLVASVATDGEIVVVAAVDGAVRWRAQGPPAPTTVVFAGDHLLVGTHDGRVVELDGGGAVVREIEVGDGPVTALAWADGTLLVGVDGVLRGHRTTGPP